MTVQAIEGTLTIPGAAAALAGAAVDELGFGRSIPAGEPAISEAFRPNPNDDAASSALFNIFIESHDFTGDVYC